MFHPPLLAMVAAAGTCSPTMLAAKLSRSIKTAIKFLNSPPETINDMLNWNWFTNGLDLSTGKLNQFLEALNFLCPPMSTVDLWECSNTIRLADVVEREHYLGHKAQHSKPKSLDPFTKGLQANLQDFTILLSNLITNFWFGLE